MTNTVSKVIGYTLQGFQATQTPVTKVLAYAMVIPNPTRRRTKTGTLTWPHK